MSLRSSVKNGVSKVGNFLENVGWGTAKLGSAIAAGSWALLAVLGGPIGTAGAAGIFGLNLGINSALLGGGAGLTGKIINSTQQALSTSLSK